MDEEHEQPPSAVIRRVKIDDIFITDGRRPINPATVAALAESIAARGLLQPIRLRTGEHDDRPIVLVAGGHRLEAAKALGWTSIDAIEDDDPDEVRAALIEIDENLIRAELSPSERARALADRKRLYDDLHPEHRHGGDRRSIQAASLAVRNDGAMGFAADTAAATGLSVRSVQRGTEHGKRISEDVMALLRGTRLDTGSYLDSIKRLPAAAQFSRVESDLRATVSKSATVEIDDDGIPTAEAAPPEPELADTPPMPKTMNWGWDDPERLVARACDLIGAERVAELAWAIAEREAGAAMPPDLPVIDDDEPLPDCEEEGDDVLDAA